MRSHELSLLHIFNAIMIEGSVTRAADLLGMTQPAVSNAIARMRDQWQDPLFIKSGRQIEPTAFASNLWEQIREPIQQLSASTQSSVFVPAESRRKFRIAMTDLSVDLFWLALLSEVSHLAPMVDLYAVPFTQVGAVDLLREARIDLALGPQGDQDRSLRSSFLYESSFKLIMRRDHPLAGNTVSMEKFLDARHLLVSRTGEAQGNVDRALQREGLKRRIAATVNHFSVVPKLLSGTDLIAVVPQRVAECEQFSSMLWVTEAPICIEPRDIYLIWHARLDRDPGLAWLRNLLEAVVAEK